jgi:hypothetical protein
MGSEFVANLQFIISRKHLNKLGEREEKILNKHLKFFSLARMTLVRNVNSRGNEREYTGVILETGCGGVMLWNFKGIFNLLISDG